MSKPLTLKKLQTIIEAAIFASYKPLKVDALLKLFPEGDEQPEKKDIQKALKALEEHYQDRGVVLKEVASGYRFQVNTETATDIGALFEEKPQRYSRALLETLALIAYRQPLTRAEIEEVRGVVVSTAIMKTLLEHQWVRIVGHRDLPGKPALYATTKHFLDHFSLKSLEDLPPLQSVESLSLSLPLEDAVEEALEESAAAEPEETAERLEAFSETVLEAQETSAEEDVSLPEELESERVSDADVRK